MQIVCPRILNRLDYCNSLPAGTTSEQMSCIQRVQNSAAKGKNAEIMLHLFLKTTLASNQTKNRFKICNISLHTLQQHFTAYTPSRSLRPCSAQLQSAPKVNLKTAGERSFRFQAPKVLNSFPVEIRQSPSLSSFKNNLKAYLFIQAFTN